MPETLNETRDEFLLAALPHVAFDGWTIKAMRAGAVELGRDPHDAERAFPGGPIDMIAHFTDLSDRRMVAATAKADHASMPTSERVVFAVRTRLEGNAPHREIIRRALSVLALPQNTALGVKLCYETVNIIWCALDDASMDFSYYTKRASLAAVYAATVLYWLNDDSPGFADTWRFLDRRIAEVMQIPKAMGRLGEAFEHLPDPLRSVRSFSGKCPGGSGGFR